MVEGGGWLMLVWACTDPASDRAGAVRSNPVRAVYSAAVIDSTFLSKSLSLGDLLSME